MAERKTAKIVRTGEWEYRVEVEANAGESPRGTIRGTDDLRATIFSLQDQGYEVRMQDCDLESEGLNDTMDCCPVCGQFNDYTEGYECEHFLGLYGEGEIYDFPDYERFAETWRSLEDLFSEIPEDQQDSFLEDLVAGLAAGGFARAKLSGLDFPYGGSVSAFQELFDVLQGPETGEGGAGPIGLYSRDPALLAAEIDTFSSVADELSGRYPREESEEDLEDDSEEGPEE